MSLKIIITVTLLLGIATANVVVKDDDWPDSLLEKNKDKLEKYVKKDNPVDIEAVILPKPDGFEDPKNWTLVSVLALIKLIKESNSSEPVLQVMRRAIKNSLAKFRGDDLDPPNTIIRIKNHMQAQLPHSEIRLMNVIDFLHQRDPNDPDSYQGPYITPPIPPVEFGPVLNSGTNKPKDVPEKGLHVQLNLNFMKDDDNDGEGNGGSNGPSKGPDNDDKKDSWLVLGK